MRKIQFCQPEKIGFLKNLNLHHNNARFQQTLPSSIVTLKLPFLTDQLGLLIFHSVNNTNNPNKFTGVIMDLRRLRHEDQVTWNSIPQEDIYHRFRVIPWRFEECITAPLTYY